MTTKDKVITSMICLDCKSKISTMTQAKWHIGHIISYEYREKCNDTA